MNQESFEKRIEELNKLVAASKRIVFFSGAGVSTESGIPDFRSKDGLYNQNDIQFEAFSPEYLLSKECLQNNPNVFYEFYRQKLDCRTVNPNIAHYLMAELERHGKIVSVVTQNIDDLHGKAGSTVVDEIHGTTRKNYCEDCMKEYDSNHIFESGESIPRCECGGKIRPDVTLYGENLPWQAWNNATDHLRNADLVIVCGTSLSVWPAAGMISYVPPRKLVIVNRDTTSMDGHASLVFHEEMGEVFSRVEFDANRTLKWLYRLESKSPDNGLWYNADNKLVWGIGKLPECKTKDLPMDYDPRYHADGRNWFSSCSNKEDLMHWYSVKDAIDLVNNGFVFTRYLATEYTEYENETVFIKDTCLAREEIDIMDLFPGEVDG